MNVKKKLFHFKVLSVEISHIGSQHVLDLWDTFPINRR